MAKAPADKVALFDAVVGLFPEIERKGAGFPYTSVNGNMFSMLNENGTLALRLPEAARAAFLARYDTSLNTAHGVVQKEYVVVPDSLLADTDELREHFAVSVAYARSLKPKNTKRKKPAG
jgi:TfoX-like protein